ncbi:MAG: glycosyltransferase family 4 protein [Actinomycetota bacterium]
MAENIVRRDGQGRVALEVCRALVSRGHRVQAYCSNLAEELQGRVEWQKVSSGQGPQLLKSILFAYRGRRAVEKEEPDLILTFGACVIASRTTTVYLCAFTQAEWQRSRVASKPRLHQRLHNRWVMGRESKGLRAARKVIVLSKRSIEEVLPMVGSRAKVELTHGAVDFAEYEQVAQTRRQVREQLGLDASFVIAIIGEYATGRKGLDALAAAVAGVRDESILVHGHGDESATMAKLEKIGARVVFADPAVPVATVLGASDLVAIPSLYETFSLVALEAAAAGCPVVISSVAGAAEHLGPADAAIVIPPNDPASLRRAIDSVRNSTDRGHAMAMRAQDVARKLTCDSASQKVVDVIERAAAADL